MNNLEGTIVHQKGNWWATKTTLKSKRTGERRPVYQVWKLSDSYTHGVLRGTYDLGEEESRRRAIERVDEEGEA